jgi:multicomponent Na+:H+ antiporter subunit G
MTAAIIAILIALGTLFSLLAAIGIVRMPDLYMRAQVVTKSSTLGTSCIALAAALSFDSFEPTVRLMLVVAFLFVTAPVAAHVIVRAAKSQDIPMWEGTTTDALDPRSRSQDRSAE